ncbi:hypothetical protein CWE08_02095 [Aliidiomarina iranensis]|uniref:Type II secretory pathway component n=1 Tax=Aliidiomarina iranensis TaxID=1434071 RepID=A0A432W2L5_9GAMM|nr:hypothetical protein [Aliidiomarina iranensis]RUO23459.1 hypothetical protein CWE08_02095 [Aliidiomarina iranensis]
MQANKPMAQAKASVLIAAVCIFSCSYFVASANTSGDAVQRDPTRPAVSAEQLAPEGERARLRSDNLQLELIRYSSEGSSAVINGDTYQIGDRLSGWDVQQIEADRVVLIRNNEQIVLSVFSGLTRSSFKDNP